jgi:hypothetical protein
MLSLIANARFAVVQTTPARVTPTSMFGNRSFGAVLAA